MTIEVWSSADELATKIAERLTARVAKIQRTGKTPSVVLTGGTIAVDAYRRISAGSADWSNVDFYWGDERFVPAGHADRNDQQARDAFLTRLAVPQERIHAMPAHGCDVSMAAAADSYAASLPTEPFDIVLLGMGPDGHIASLFPGFAQLHETHRRAVEVFGSPKPPPERISLTYPALNHADSVWLLVSGSAKAAVVAQAVNGTDIERIPASGVHGLTETVWILDHEAAQEVTA